MLSGILCHYVLHNLQYVVRHSLELSIRAEGVRDASFVSQQPAAPVFRGWFLA
jgi:hypothetical protein